MGRTTACSAVTWFAVLRYFELMKNGLSDFCHAKAVSFPLLTASIALACASAAGGFSYGRIGAGASYAMASIAARAARRAISKSSMSGAVASTIALATWSTRSGVAAEPAVTIAAKLFATLAQNVPKAALQRPANGISIGNPGARPPEAVAPRSATGRSGRPRSRPRPASSAEMPGRARRTLPHFRRRAPSAAAS